MAVPLKRIRKKIALNISILNQRDLPLRSYVRCGGTLADLIRKAPPPFIPEAGIFRVLQEEDVNYMRAHSLKILQDPITAISVLESRQQQVSIPKSDRTPVHDIYWKIIGQFRHQSVVGRRLIALCLERVDCKPLRDLFHINDGFNHRFFFLVLHAWILHQRLTLEGWKGEVVDDQLFHFLQIAILDWMWMKNVEAFRFATEAQHCQACLFGFCIALDKALQQIDILPSRIHEVLWLHLYQADVNPDEDYLDTFTKYVIRQWTHILQLERDHILEGMFSWASFPMPGIPRSRAIHPFSQQYQEFGYSPNSWNKLKKRMKVYNKYTEMGCMKDYANR